MQSFPLSSIPDSFLPVLAFAAVGFMAQACASAPTAPTAPTAPIAPTPPGNAVFESPETRPVSLRLSQEEGLALEGFGACCVHREIRRRPQGDLAVSPVEEGWERRYATLEVGAWGEVEVAYEREASGPPRGGPIRLTVDTDGDRDLTDEEVLKCQDRAYCGPVTVSLRRGDGRLDYPVRFRIFRVGGQEVIWYTRASALVGESAGGVRFAVLDENTNGSFDDPADRVAVDVDGNGSFSAAVFEAERFARFEPFPSGDGFSTLVSVDPVAAVAQVAEVARRSITLQVLDRDGKRPVEGARVRVEPGAVRGVTDAGGWVDLEVLAAPVDFLSVFAPGYWGQVLAQGLSSPLDQPGQHTFQVLLEAGPCPEEALWCGRETLGASTVDRSSVDLETGVYGPRPGAYPGPPDIGWYVPPGGWQLSATGVGPGRLTHLGVMDFAALGAAELGRLPLDQKDLLGHFTCGEKGEGRGEDSVRVGSVVGVRTREGRLAKVRVDRCGHEVQISWVVYP